MQQRQRFVRPRRLIGAHYHLVGQIAPEQRIQQRRRAGMPARADDRYLFGRRQMKVQRRQPATGAGRRPRHQFRQALQRSYRLAPVIIVAGDYRQAQQQVGGYRTAAGLGVVEHIARAHHQILVAAPGVIERPGRRIPEELQHRIGQLEGGVQPAAVESGLIQRQQAVGHKGIVLQIAGQLGLPVAVGTQQAAVGVPHRFQQKGGVAGGGVQVIAPLPGGAGLRQRFQHQPVPRGQHLVVQQRRNTGGPAAAQRLFAALNDVHQPLHRQVVLPGEHGGFAGNVEDVAALEVAARRNPEESGEHRPLFAAQRFLDFVQRPDEELALYALAVGVGSGVEPAGRPGHFPQDVIQRFFGDAAVQRPPAGQPGVEVQPGQQSVVVEHLFEVRHQPVGVHRIAVEPAAKLVIDAAPGHLFQREMQHFHSARVMPLGVIAQQHFQRHRLRELGRAARPAVLVVEVGGQRGIGAVQNVAGKRGVAAGQMAGAPHLFGKLPGHPLDFRRAVEVGTGDGLQQPGKAGHIGPVGGRKVGAAVERLAVGRQKDGHGPAAAAGQQLHRLHIDGVQVGPLFPVDLDVDEVAVHQGGDVVVLEGLALHHMAPVAGGIADAEQDGLVFGLRPLQRLRPPGIPVHRVVGVLQQVGAGFVNQSVGHNPPSK